MESLLTKVDNLEPWLRAAGKKDEKANPFWSNYFKV